MIDGAGRAAPIVESGSTRALARAGTQLRRTTVAISDVPWSVAAMALCGLTCDGQWKPASEPWGVQGLRRERMLCSSAMRKTALRRLQESSAAGVGLIAAAMDAQKLVAIDMIVHGGVVTASWLRTQRPSRLESTWQPPRALETVKDHKKFVDWSLSKPVSGSSKQVRPCWSRVCFSRRYVSWSRIADMSA